MKRQLSSTFNDSQEFEESPDQSFILLAVTSSGAKQQATKQPSLQKTSQSTARNFILTDSPLVLNLWEIWKNKLRNFWKGMTIQ